MRYRFLHFLPLLGMLVPASAQVALRPFDMGRVNEVIASQAANRNIKSADKEAANVTLLMRYESEAALRDIESHGGRIVSLVGYNTAIVSAPATAAASIAGTKDISAARLSTKLKPASDKAIPLSNITNVRAGKDLPSGYSGKGVVLGVFDIGMDPNHVNFLDADGLSRVQKFWHYPESSSEPICYESPEEIADFTSDYTAESHGTHVMGIMAGNYFERRPGAPDYRGVAPDAELIAAGGWGYDGQILDAMERIGKYAQEKGLPCVANLSFGDNLGPHDGSDLFTATLNDIVKKYDMTLCLAAGNEREKPVAIIKELTAADPELKTVVMKNSSSYSYTQQATGPLEIWAQDDTPFEVYLDVISPENLNTPLYTLKLEEGVANYVSQGTLINSYIDVSLINLVKSGTEFQTTYYNSFMGGEKYVDPANGRYTALVNFWLDARTADLGQTRCVRVRVKGQPGKKIFMFCDNSYMTLGNNGLMGMDAPDGNGTHSNMASGLETICVGSYVSYNRPESGYPNGTIGTTSYFSSYGETLDGRVMPDVCTPGQVIMSSRNSYADKNGDLLMYYPLSYSVKYTNGKTYYWTTCAGTSQASPQMAGIAALWRSANPELNHKQIQQIARDCATLPSSGKGWGYGKVDAYKGVQMALEMASIYDIMDNNEETIFVEGSLSSGLHINAPGQESLNVSIYNMEGREVARHSASGSTLDLTPGELTPGVYVVKVAGSHTTRTLKMTY